MGIVYNNGRGERRESAWNDSTNRNFDNEELETPENIARLYAMDVSLKEQQLLLRLRMLGAGEFVVMVYKDQRGMIGLKEWNVEDIP